MLGKIMLFISISIIGLYMGYVTKNRLHMYGGFVFLIFMAGNIPDPEVFLTFFRHNISFVDELLLLKVMRIISTLMLIAFVIYALYVGVRDVDNKMSGDIDMVLVPNRRNVIFWVLMVMLNIIVFVMWG
jgi:hypothetical protein